MIEWRSFLPSLLGLLCLGLLLSNDVGILFSLIEHIFELLH
jgi:hypothetical protein